MTHQSREQNNILGSFDSTLTDSNLQDLGVSLAEVGIDHILDDGLLRDVPVVGVIYNLSKVGANIQDRLFLKKILSFLNQLKDIPAGKRKEMIDKIDNSKKYRVKVGEKLLYIIDSCDDYEISELVSIVFGAWIKGEITYVEFMKTASVLKKINKSDFDWFVKERSSHHFDINEVGDLVSSGLFELYYEEVSVHVEDESDWKTVAEGGRKYNARVEDGGAGVLLSRAGEVILEIFCPSYKKSKSVKL